MTLTVLLTMRVQNTFGLTLVDLFFFILDQSVCVKSYLRGSITVGQLYILLLPRHRLRQNATYPLLQSTRAGQTLVYQFLLYTPAATTSQQWLGTFQKQLPKAISPLNWCYVRFFFRRFLRSRGNHTPCLAAGYFFRLDQRLQLGGLLCQEVTARSNTCAVCASYCSSRPPVDRLLG